MKPSSTEAGTATAPVTTLLHLTSIAKRLRRMAPGLATGTALAVILLIASVLRLAGLDWDAGHHLHPDERFITMVETAIELPRNFGQYFETANSPLNPYNRNFGSYVYGTLPLFFVRAIAEAIQAAARSVPQPWEPLVELWPHLREAAGYGDIHRLGRVLSALADVATVALVYFIGARLGGRWLGLLASLLCALAVLQIQSAHFFTAESPLILLTTVAFFFAVRVAQGGGWFDWIGLGIASGLAVSTKLTAGVLAVVVLAAAFVVWLRWRTAPPEERGASPLEEIVTGLVAAGASAFLVFRVSQPYAFAGPGFFDFAPNPKYLADLENWQRIASGQADYPPSHQWTGATPFMWQLVNMTLWGLGPPLAISAWLGFALAGIQFLRAPSRHSVHLLGLLWVGTSFLYWGPQFAKPMRYLLPIYPQLAIFAAMALIACWQAGRAGRARPAAIGETGAFDPPEGDRPERLGAGGIVKLLRTGLAGALPSIARTGLAGALPAIVIGYSAFYAVAFTSIYTKPTTRVAASEWIYANLPAGARIGFEHWDDPLPLRLPGRDSAIYPGIEFPLYGEDTPEKREQLITKLNDADYLVLSSNRLYGSIPKLPERYPMTTRYYQALFGGELGFEPVAEFTSRPGLLGIELNDDDAEEIFTVYEHPKVTVFRKGPSYSGARVRALLESVSLDRVLRGLKPIHADSGGLLLDDRERAAVREGGTWADMFDRRSLANQIPVFVWYLVVELLGIVAFPLVWYACRGLADRGYVLSKTVGLLAIAYVPWLMASFHLLPYTRGAILLALVLLATASIGIAARFQEQLRAFLVAQRGALLAFEGLFAAIFLGFLAIRAANPDLWHPSYGGEKPMDYAYLNAVIRSTWFPPYDPWLAGGYINYYYFGFVIIASLTKLTGVVPWVAYNLALPTIAALTATTVAALVYSLLVSRPERTPTRRKTWALAGGVLGALLAVVSGNLHGAVQLFQWLGRIGGDQIASLVPGVGAFLGALRGGLLWLLSPVRSEALPNFQFDFWAPTRVITTEPVTPITEFPFFTFLYGDLHAHMIAMPLFVMGVALALNLARSGPLQPPAAFSVHPRDWLRTGAALALSPAGLTLLAASVLLGVLRMTNTWDYPTYFGILILALVMSRGWVGRGELRASPTAVGETSEDHVPFRGAPRLSRDAVGTGRARALFAVARQVLVIAIVSQAAVSPFLSSYEQFYTGIELSKGHTTLSHYLTIVGAFLAVLAGYLLVRISAARTSFAAGAKSLLGAWSGGSAMAARAEPPPVEEPTLPDSATPRPGESVGEPPPAAGPVTEWLPPAAAGMTLMLALLLGVGGLPVLSVALVALTLIGVFVVHARTTPGMRFTLLLAATAIALTAGVEVVTLKGDIGRMNTVFKFYLQAWFLLAVTGSVLLTLLARRAWASRWLRRGWRLALGLGLVLLVTAGLVYPLLGTPSRLQHRFVPLEPSLDGMAFMVDARYEDNGRNLLLADDHAAINWLLDNVQGTPVIVEGLAPLYHWGARVSIYTGLPTVQGWDWHQKQQRGDFAYMVDDRTRDVGEIFRSTSTDVTLALLRKYGVEYVYVGGLERAFYPPDGLQKFERMTGSSLERVYARGAVTIYRVRA